MDPNYSFKKSKEYEITEMLHFGLTHNNNPKNVTKKVKNIKANSDGRYIDST